MERKNIIKMKMLLYLVLIIIKILIPENAISFDNKNYILIGNNDNDNNGFYFSDNIINDKLLINGTKIYDFSKISELTEGSGKLIELEIFEINQN